MAHQTLEYQQLDKFVGIWHTKGIIPQSDNSPETKISGTDTYEWLPGEFFLKHTVNVWIGEIHNHTLEIIGFDPSKQKYTMQYYDNRGGSGFMTATFRDDVWRFQGAELRFVGGFSHNDTLFSGIWEQKQKDGDWAILMEIELSKTVINPEAIVNQS